MKGKAVESLNDQLYTLNLAKQRDEIQKKKLQN